jgi:hypothetical protein
MNRPFANPFAGRAGLLTVACVSLLASSRARAQAAPANSTAPAPASPAAATPEDDAKLRRELEEAIKSDAAARTAGKGAAPSGSTDSAPAPQAAPASPLMRGMQSLNPDLSAIIDTNAGFQTTAPAWAAGDDPQLPAHANGHHAGFTAQEVEVALSAIVDPYLKGEVYLTIPNLSGLEVEEAVATTTSLPWNLQVRAGSFRGAFGRQNGQHLHVQDFTTRPLINAAFLGEDGMRGPGAQVSWLAPLPFFLTLYLEGFSLSPPDDGSFATFGGTQQGGLTGAAHVKAFFPLTDELSLYTGVSSALGHTAGVSDPFGIGVPVAQNAQTELVGGDVYLKWKPANESGGYRSVAWQTEAIFRRRGPSYQSGSGADELIVPGEWDGGLYSQVVIQLARRFFLGLRLDWLGLPTSLAMPRTTRETASFTFQMSEFARLRLEAYADQFGPRAAADALYPQPAHDGTAGQGLLMQLEISIGAHGAHAF